MSRLSLGACVVDSAGLTDWIPVKVGKGLYQNYDDMFICMSTPIAVRLPDDLAHRLDVLSRETTRPQSDYIREAVEDRLDRMEWEQSILRIREDVQSGREKIYSAEEVRRHLGLDG